MKKAVGRIVLRGILAPLTRLVYQKYRPAIVAITGSVGKTTTREAVYQTLAPHFDVQKAMGNGNADWSVVATLLNPGYTPFTKNENGWGIMLPHHIIWCWLVGIFRFFLPLPYPKIFVLELGVDAPSDMEFFNSLMKYDVAVVTRVGQAHLEFFGEYKHLFAEKVAIYSGLKPTGLAISSDQADLKEFVDKLVVRHTIVGTALEADVREVNAAVEKNGVDYSYALDGQTIDLHLPIGRQWSPAAMIALAVGREFGLTLEQMQVTLSNLKAVDRRFQVYELARGIHLVDDAYNANLDSMGLALESLQDISAKHRIGILGDMKELGSETQEAHLEVGRLAASKLDYLITVGVMAHLISEGAQMAGMPVEKIIELPELVTDVDLHDAVDAILSKISDNDAVLIKASRAMKLYRVAEDIIKKLS